MPNVKISLSMFENLEYDNEVLSGKEKKMSPKEFQPTAMIVFAESDINAATHHVSHLMEMVSLITDSLETVLVQESIRNSFIEKLRGKLKPYDGNITQTESFQQAFETITRMNLNTIVANNSKGNSPTLVCDVTHDHIKAGSGVVTFHTFRTAKEAISLFGKEGLSFANASIWNSDFSCSYELVSALNCQNFFLNCVKSQAIALDSVMEQNKDKTFALLIKNYHYECLQEGKKVVVFPIGTIFAN